MTSEFQQKSATSSLPVRLTGAAVLRYEGTPD